MSKFFTFLPTFLSYGHAGHIFPGNNLKYDAENRGISQRKPRKQTEKQSEEYGVKTGAWMKLQKRDARLAEHRAEDAIFGGVSDF
jgi:hypothetical protein